MTNHPIPYRFELELEVAGTPDEVWEAIATPQGISSWMLLTEIEPREGGALTVHMGPEVASHGQVTAFEPARRLVYEEDWATLVGHPGAEVSPLATEFIVEARSGGTCVVRVVSSAFGTGADWEQEFWSEMSLGWAPMLDNLRVYMSHFRGEHATQLFASATCGGTPEVASAALRDACGIEGVTGEPFGARGLTGVVERSIDRHFLVRVEQPVTGMLSFFSYDSGEAITVQVLGYIFDGDAAGYVEREQQAWCEWLADATAGLAAASPA